MGFLKINPLFVYLDCPLFVVVYEVNTRVGACHELDFDIAEFWIKPHESAKSSVYVGGKVVVTSHLLGFYEKGVSLLLCRADQFLPAQYTPESCWKRIWLFAEVFPDDICLVYLLSLQVS